jgi:predicted HicB family RNase H-like nuclease
MTREAAINKLKSVWRRARVDQISNQEETAHAPGKRAKSDRTAQMNLRIRPGEKHRIAVIALRENVSINEIFSRMLELYEREHGKAEITFAKIADNE